MNIKSVALGQYQTNCYLIIDEDTKEAVIIDPGEDNNGLQRLIDSNDVILKAIVLTHGHMDHTAGVIYLNEKYNIPVYIHEKDADMMYKNTFMFGKLPEKREVIYIVDGEILEFGNIKLKVIFTPGHTPGGVCFKLDNLIFSGDTIFYTSIGRTDLPGGDFETLMNSIFNKLLVLDNSINLYPGHGRATTIGFEKTHNDFLI